MGTCTAICQDCACAKAITFLGILWVVPQAKCTQFTFTETLSFAMEITTIHLELWKVSMSAANSRAKFALWAKLVALLAVTNADFCCTAIVTPPERIASPLPVRLLCISTKDWALN